MSRTFHCLFPFLVHAPLLGYWVWMFYRDQAAQPLRPWLWAGLLAKCAAGIGLGLLYLHHYPYRGDTFAIFDESVVLSKLAFRQPGGYLKTLFFNDFGTDEALNLLLKHQPRAFFAAKLLSCLNLFTFHNYWLTGLYCSLFGFWGFWRLGNVLAAIYPHTRTAAAVAFLLFPSVVFWSSGVLKESIAMGCIANVLATGLPFCFATTSKTAPASGIGNASGKGPSGQGLRKMLCVLVCGWVVWQLKFYYFGALLAAALPLAAAVVLHRQYGIRHQGVLLFLQILFFGVVLGAAAWAARETTGHSLLVAVVANHHATVGVSQPGTYVVFDPLLPTVRSFAGHFPLALWSGLFAPLPWQARHWLALGAAIENAALLGLAVLCLARVFRFSEKPARLSVPAGLAFSKDTILPDDVALKDAVLARLLVLAAGMYVVLLAAALALSSPNFGALARYKVGFVPVLAYVLLAVTGGNPLKKYRRA